MKFVVNTHYHPDHVAGNAVFANTGATVVAHRNVRGWIHTENLNFLGPNPKPRRCTSLLQEVLDGNCVGGF